MIYPRDLIKEMAPFIKRKEFIALIGPRQAGKTTFLEILAKHLRTELKVSNEMIRKVTFEDRVLLAQFEADPVSFVRSFIPEGEKGTLYLMIDEFQYAANGGQKLKLVYDTIDKIKIFVTGSSSLDIKAQVGKYMVGRIVTFHLYPFNFGEFLNVKDKRLAKLYHQGNEMVLKWIFKGGGKNKIRKGADPFSEEMLKLMEEYAVWGGYPAVILCKNINEKRKVLRDIYNNYIMKDIKTLLQLATENNLYLLSQYLATQTGSIVVYQNLGQAAGLDYRNLKKHLNILKETFICQEVKPFFRNRQKELTKNPKIFYLDLGFRNNILENMNALEKRPDAGAIMENYVFIRLNELVERGENIKFWRTKAGAEVDFVLQSQGEIVPIEVKYSRYTTEKISKGFASFSDSFKPKRAVILTKNYWGSMKRKDTEIVFSPVYYV
ncbi:MAG: ATP-binding protein [Candidatus Margulisiibacteriota bacterium]